MGILPGSFSVHQEALRIRLSHYQDLCNFVEFKEQRTAASSEGIESTIISTKFPTDSATNNNTTTNNNNNLKPDANSNCCDSTLAEPDSSLFGGLLEAVPQHNGIDSAIQNTSMPEPTLQDQFPNLEGVTSINSMTSEKISAKNKVEDHSPWRSPCCPRCHFPLRG